MNEFMVNSILLAIVIATPFLLIHFGVKRIVNVKYEPI